MSPKKCSLPYDIEKVSPDEEKIIRKCLYGYTRTFVRCGPKGYIMPGQFKHHAEAIYNMDVRPDDVWVVTFPRSGTTWTQELVWLVQNDLNFKKAKSIPLHDRFPMLEITSLIPELGTQLIKMNFMNLGYFQGLGEAVRTPSWELIKNAPSPRFIKTHLPLSMLPPNLLQTCKVVYVARDPRDVAVSYYYLHKLSGKSLYKTTMKEFWEAFRRDLLPWCPTVSHADEAYSLRHHPNLLFLFYEDLIRDLPQEIRRVCQFFDKKFPESDVRDLAAHLSFDSIRKNKTVNNTVHDKQSEVQFIRKGEVGGWVNHFDKQMSVQAEEYLEARLRLAHVQYPSISLYKECSYL